MKYIKILLTFALTILISGCFDQGGIGDTNRELTIILLNPVEGLDKDNVISDEQIAMMSAIYIDTKTGQEVDITDIVSWSTSNSQVTIDNNGAIAIDGTLSSFEIKATYLNTYETEWMSIHLISPDPEFSITLNSGPKTFQASPGDEVKYSSWVNFYSEGKLVHQDITASTLWESDNNGVYICSKQVEHCENTNKGVVKISPSLSTTTVTISATYNNVVSDNQLRVSPDQDKEITSIEIDIDDATDLNDIYLGQYLQASATLTYADGEKETVTESVTWVSSAPHVANIDPSGLIIANGPGSAHIKVQVSDLLSNQIELSVNDYQVTNLEISSTLDDIISLPKRMASQDFYSMVTYSNGIKKYIYRGVEYQQSEQLGEIKTNHSDDSFYFFAGDTEGTTEVTTSFQGIPSSNALTFEIIDNELIAIELDELSETMTEGEVAQFIVLGKYKDGKSYPIPSISNRVFFTFDGSYDSDYLSYSANGGGHQLTANKVTDYPVLVKAHYFDLANENKLHTDSQTISVMPTVDYLLDFNSGSRTLLNSVMELPKTLSNNEGVHYEVEWSTNSNSANIHNNSIFIPQLGFVDLEATFVNQPSISNIYKLNRTTLDSVSIIDILLSFEESTQTVTVKALLSDGSTSNITPFVDWRFGSDEVLFISSQGKLILLSPGGTTASAQYSLHESNQIEFYTNGNAVSEYK